MLVFFGFFVECILRTGYEVTNEIFRPVSEFAGTLRYMLGITF